MPPVPLNGGAMCFPDLSYQGHDSMDHQLVRHQGGQSLHDQRQPGGEHPTRLGRPRITVPINPNDACRPATGRPANLIVSAREFTDAALKDSLPLASAALDRCFVEVTNRRNEDSSYVAPAHTFLTPVEHVWGTEIRPLKSEAQELPLTCSYPVVGTGVDPVTSRFSAALGVKWDRCPDQGGNLKFLFRRGTRRSFGIAKRVLLRAVARSCGHVVGTKLHTPYGYTHIHEDF
jgi:hypothetical protein